MSTFKGVIDEFPTIRVDYFRVRPGTQAPLACFLSHVHSDHLEGLESFKSPFLYCSAATREILIRLERKIHRIMFATGVTEVRKPQYKKLKNLLKPIPLETPTRIELTPGNEIQVTLFDANHCTGAVMFLFEGNGKAVLYTGDIRSEPWWINNLTRNPFMIEYAKGGLKTLDCMYLDTSNTSKMEFPTKAEGLQELLQKVSKYPKDTVFHFATWTFGYEEVWMALSKSLNTPIHVDTYKLRLYKALRGNAADPTKEGTAALAHEGPVLTGYTCGNTPIPGCLTDDHTVRLHSCEKGLCQSIDENNKNIVWIRPIVTRTKDGAEMAEVGVGGGGEDLSRHPELELDAGFEQLLNFLDMLSDPTVSEMKKILTAGPRAASKNITLNGISMGVGDGSLKLPQILQALAQLVQERISSATEIIESQGSSNELPRLITFPYSRHSSYDELCDLVKAFQPRDVYPCTVDEQYWTEAGISISSLFGRLCVGKNFRHEAEMEEWLESRAPRRESQQTHTTTDSQSSHPAVIDSPEQMVRSLPPTKISGGAFPYPVMLRRNSLGRLRPFGPDGEEILPTSETLVRTTPPRIITAVSPHSESQNLRRKAIQDQFEDGEVKRIRLDYDGSHSSPTTNLEEHSQPSHEQAVIEQNSAGDITYTPAIETRSIPSSSSAIRPRNPDIHPEEYWANDPESYEYEGVVFDHVDGIYRCERCGHELWGGPDGSCTGKSCDALDEPPYFTDIDGEDIGAGTERDLMRVGTRRRPGIAADEETDELLEGERRRTLVGYCLDDDSSAYDSQDLANSEDFRDLEDYDYEDSFIDDPNSEDEGDNGSSQDDDPSKDEELDHEAMYNQVRAQYDSLRDQQDNLINAYDALDEEHQNLRNQFGLYSSEDDESDEMDEMDELDEDGVLVVDVTAPNPVVTEIVVAQAREQSQESELSEDRIRARVEAFESAQGGSGWHEISLMSTTGNHTYPEVEL